MPFSISGTRRRSITVGSPFTNADETRIAQPVWSATPTTTGRPFDAFRLEGARLTRVHFASVRMSRMLEMLRDLVDHKGHANAALLTAIRQNGAAASDPELLELLHHILLANRFWLLTVLAQPFVLDDEARPSPSFDALVQRYGSTQAQESAWLEAASEDDLAWILEDARIPG